MTQVISMDKKYKTVSGLDVRILCVDAKKHKNVLGLVKERSGNEVVYMWYEDGSFLKQIKDEYDLIEVDPFEDFRNLPVDTPVWVRDFNDEEWNPRHWKKLNTKDPVIPFVTFVAGSTYHSQGDDAESVSWCQCRLTKPE